MTGYLREMYNALDDSARLAALALADDAGDAVRAYRDEFEGFTRELPPELNIFVVAEALGACIGGGLTGRRVRQMATEGVFLSIKIKGQRGLMFHLGFNLWRYLEHAQGDGEKTDFPLAGAVRRARDSFHASGVAALERDGTSAALANALESCIPTRNRKRDIGNHVPSETPGRGT